MGECFFLKRNVTLCRRVSRPRRPRSMGGADDDVDVLYGDVDDTDVRANASNASTSTKHLQAIGRMNAQLEEMREEVRRANDARAAADAKCETLERNISCLFNTARAEIARKDAEIARLREEATTRA